MNILRMVLLLIVGTAFCQEGVPLEPEAIGVVHVSDQQAKSLAPLERNVAQVVKGLLNMFFEIDGERSPVRVSHPGEQILLVALAGGADPTKIQLYAMESKRGKRKFTFAKGKGGAGNTSINVARYGKSSYRLNPVKPLQQGEYCFSVTTSNDVFCFGVDLK